MAGALFFAFLALSRLMLLQADDGSRNQTHPHCPHFNCGNFRKIKFPFTEQDRPECGLCIVHGCNSTSQKIQLVRKGPLYPLENISQGDTITIKDERLEKFLKHCENLTNLAVRNTSYLSFSLTRKIDIFECDSSVSDAVHTDFNYTGCPNYKIYYNSINHSLPTPPPPQCSPIQLPANSSQNFSDIFSVLTATFDLNLNVPPACIRCHYHEFGECDTNSKGEFQCRNRRGIKRDGKLKLRLGLGIGCPAIVMAIISAYVFGRRCNKREFTSTHSNHASSDPSSKSDLEGGTVCFGVPIFSYNELEEATNHFDSEKELGDGGFGTVY